MISRTVSIEGEKFWILCRRLRHYMYIAQITKGSVDLMQMAKAAKGSED
jgi:hypothetical protein